MSSKKRTGRISVSSNIRRLGSRGATAVTVTAALALTASPASGAGLPDGRKYEQVTPVDKNGHNGYPADSQAAPTGDGFAFETPKSAAFPGSTQNVNNLYFVERSAAGWVTRALLPPSTFSSPGGDVMAGNTVVAYSNDVMRMLLDTTEGYDPADDNGAGPIGNHGDAYRIDSDGMWTWMSRGTTSLNLFSRAAYLYATSPDLETVVFASQDSLDPHRPVVPGASMGNGYLYKSDGGIPTLIGTLPDGAVDTSGAFIGSPGNGLSNNGQDRHAVSDDGSRIVFSGSNNGTDPSADPSAQIYLWAGGQTTLISRDAIDDTPADPGVRYVDTVWGDEPDQGTIYFTAHTQLTPDAPAMGGLYAHDIRSGSLSYLVPAGYHAGRSCNVDPPNQCSDMVGIADNGSRIYFVSSSVLASGSIGGQRNLYVYDAHQGQVSLVAALDETRLGAPEVADGPPFNGLSMTHGFVQHQQAQLTPGDGRFLIFASPTPVTGFDGMSAACRASNGNCQQIYRYDAVTRDLSCVSCGARPVTGNSWLGNPIDSNSLPTGSRGRQARFVSDDGSYVFFNSAQAIVPEDTNDKVDGYQWHDGRISLLTTGRSSTGAYFLTSAANGRDAFITTRDRLVTQDRDNLFDIYDARIGGGFSDWAPDPDCSADSCQGRPTDRPARDEAASPLLKGSGEVSSAQTARPRFSVQRVSARRRALFARTGRLRLRVRVNRAGRVTVAGRAIVDGRSQRVAHATSRARSAGAVGLTLRLSRAARRQLAARGTLGVSLWVRFTGAPRAKALGLSLRRTGADR